jgi:hypothetical protein
VCTVIQLIYVDWNQISRAWLLVICLAHYGNLGLFHLRQQSTRTRLPASCPFDMRQEKLASLRRISTQSETPSACPARERSVRSTIPQVGSSPLLWALHEMAIPQAASYNIALAICTLTTVHAWKASGDYSLRSALLPHDDSVAPAGSGASTPCKYTTYKQTT